MKPKKQILIAFRVDSDTEKAIKRRVKELRTDMSSYIRQCVISEILMKSDNQTFQKQILS